MHLQLKHINKLRMKTVKSVGLSTPTWCVCIRFKVGKKIGLWLLWREVSRFWCSLNSRLLTPTKTSSSDIRITFALSKENWRSINSAREVCPSALKYSTKQVWKLLQGKNVLQAEGEGRWFKLAGQSPQEPYTYEMSEKWSRVVVNLCWVYVLWFPVRSGVAGHYCNLCLID